MDIIRKIIRILLFWKKKKNNYVSYEHNVADSKILAHFERDNYGVIDEKTINNSITVSYQEKKWNEERILLDGIQNHLPSDSKGTWFGIQIKIEGKWFDYSKIHEIKNNEVEAVRFIDNGRGFVAEELGVFSSDKRDKEKARGQFGEGLKMISAASIRLGMQMIIESRFWQAKPRYVDVQLTDRKEQQLVFDVNYYDSPIKGSTTTFYKPTNKLINIIREVELYVLPVLGKNYKPAFQSEAGDILETGERHFVQGTYFPTPNINSLFSYNLENIDPESINRDRDHIDIGEFNENVKKIITELDKTELIEKICKNGLQDQNYREIKLLQYIFPKYPELYVNTLKKILKNNKLFIRDRSFLEEKEKKQEDYLQKLGYKIIITESLEFRSFLTRCNIPNTKDLIKKYGFNEEEIITSFTLEYAPEKWDEERILIDAIQNHLSSDSGGKKISIAVCLDKKWIPLDKYKKNHHSFKKISAIRISDNGKGYSTQFLTLAYSTKDGKSTRGMHGEGLKLLSAAALKRGMRVKFRSQKWKAQADKNDLFIDGDRIKQLKFNVKYLKKKRKGSETIIENLTHNMIKEVSMIKTKILSLDKKYKPLDKNRIGEIVKIGGGRIYVKGNKVTDEEKNNLLFSYNFLDNFGFDCRDRNQYALRALQDKIKIFFSTITHLGSIEHLLKSASKDKKQKVEYQEFDLSWIAQTAWRKAFQNAFGRKTVLSTSPRTHVEATNLGYDVKVFPEGILKTMIKCKILRDIDVLSARKYESIPIENLLPKEQEVFKLYTLIDEMLGVNIFQKRANIVVFEIAYGLNDVPLIGLLGSWNKEHNTIYIQRSQLQSPKEFLSTFTEERAHQMSGAPDYSRELVTFLTDKIAEFTLEMNEEDHKNDDIGVLAAKLKQLK